MLVCEYIAARLAAAGVSTVFGYIGGNITYLVDAICQRNDLSYVQTYHEQGAAFAANAYAQVSGDFGVAISSSGPGAINLMNGIANAYYDSIPCLFITGNVNSQSLQKINGVRQNAFQEADIVSMASEITLYSKQVLNADEIVCEFDKCIDYLSKPRSGPVLLDLPHDIQRTDIDTIPIRTNYDIPFISYSSVGTDIIDQCAEYINQAKQPLILVGGGCRNDETRGLLATFVSQTGIPVVSSLCGKDAFANDNALYMGMIGAFGNDSANIALKSCDVLMVLGSRLDDRQVQNADIQSLYRKILIHVDIDEYELGRRIPEEIAVNCDVRYFLRRIIDRMGYNKPPRQIGTNIFCFRDSVNDIFKINDLISSLPDVSVIVADVGMHQMLVAKAAIIRKGIHFLNSGGLGSMGYAIPAAIGAAYAIEKGSIIVFVGDGGLQMNIQEIGVIARERLPILIVVMNNHQLQMISKLQEIKFERKYNGSIWGYTVPDIRDVSTLYKIPYYSIEQLPHGIQLPAITEINYE